MSKDFADWYQSVTFGHNHDVKKLREEGAKAAVEALDDDTALDLVRLVFNGTINSEQIDNFRKHFKETDPAFKSSGNDQEVIVLAGWVLAETCSNICSPATMAILTAAACGARKPLMESNLVDIAHNEILIDGDNARKRQVIKIPEKKSVDDFLNPDDKTLEQVFETLKSLSSYLDTIQAEQIEQATTIQASFEIQDEELQILCWL